MRAAEEEEQGGGRKGTVKADKHNESRNIKLNTKEANDDAVSGPYISTSTTTHHSRPPPRC